ncbi:MAG: hypothetical protein FJY97_08040 [candidate division Zixibacteria bacterium]|nr:hypothetical protein [candidate division Zixibacteria bacterium]
MTCSAAVLTVFGVRSTAGGDSVVPLNIVYELEINGVGSALVATVRVYVPTIVGLRMPDAWASSISTLARLSRLLGGCIWTVRVADVPMAVAGVPLRVIPYMEPSGIVVFDGKTIVIVLDAAVSAPAPPSVN